MTCARASPPPAFYSAASRAGHASVRSCQARHRCLSLQRLYQFPFLLAVAEHRRGAERARRDICREGQGTHRNDQVGNVGLMLTAATRVYLMEPYRSTRRWRCRAANAISCAFKCVFVATCAGGLAHPQARPDQARPVKRFCYRNSIDASVIRSHDRMWLGDLAIANKCFLRATVELFLDTRDDECQTRRFYSPEVCLPSRHHVPFSLPSRFISLRLSLRACLLVCVRGARTCELSRVRMGLMCVEVGAAATLGQHLCLREEHSNNTFGCRVRSDLDKFDSVLEDNARLAHTQKALFDDGAIVIL
eukprot:6201696-Pleurochrysis_carterae.AAC.2